ncbi:MAG: hypothetical protein ACI97P_002451 [Arcticibacterium sp.]|jgi:hypothetical protein
MFKKAKASYLLETSRLIADQLLISFFSTIAKKLAKLKFESNRLDATQIKYLLFCQYFQFRNNLYGERLKSIWQHFFSSIILVTFQIEMSNFDLVL